MQQSECRRIINSARDPFKQTVYMLLACYTPSGSFPSPIATTQVPLWRCICIMLILDILILQDWIWFHLALILQEVNSDTFINALRRLQQLVCKFGPDHFNAKKHPLLYFQVTRRTQTTETAKSLSHSYIFLYRLFLVHSSLRKLLSTSGVRVTMLSRRCILRQGSISTACCAHPVRTCLDLPIPFIPMALVISCLNQYRFLVLFSIGRGNTGGRGAVDLPRMLWHYALAVVEQRHDLGLALNYIHLMRSKKLPILICCTVLTDEWFLAETLSWRTLW